MISEALQRWLEQQCVGNPAIAHAVIVWHRRDSAALQPAGVWPLGVDTPMALLACVSSTANQDVAVRQDFVVETPENAALLAHVGGAPSQKQAGRKNSVGDSPATSTLAAFGHPIRVEGGCVGAIGLAVECASDEAMKGWAVWLQSASTALSSNLRVQAKKEEQQAQETVEPVSSAGHDANAVLALMGEFILADGVEDACRRLVAMIASRFGAVRASVGMGDPRNPSRVRLIAVSDATSIAAGLPMHQALRCAMEECQHQGRSISYPAQRQGMPVADLAHSQLSRVSGAESVCSVPLAHKGVVVGVLTLQRESTSPPSTQEVAMLEHVAAFVGPALYLQAHSAGKWTSRLRGPASRTARQLPAWMSWWPGALAGVVLITTLIPFQHRVNAPARLQGVQERSVVAPQDGYISKVMVRPGESVTQGQVIAEFETEGMDLERRRLEAELAQAESAFGEALGKHDRSQMVTQQARIEQSRSRLDTVLRDMAKARISAPFAGLVLSGDLTRAVGSPVKRGDVLMTIAPEKGYRLMLWVDERDIEHISLSQKGHLLLAAETSESLPVTVSRITPVAAVRDGSNGFEVEAMLDGDTSGLRPGLEGIAKLDVGSRALGWLLGHRLANWVSLHWWSWIG